MWSKMKKSRNCWGPQVVPRDQESDSKRRRFNWSVEFVWKWKKKKKTIKCENERRRRLNWKKFLWEEGKGKKKQSDEDELEEENCENDGWIGRESKNAQQRPCTRTVLIIQWTERALYSASSVQSRWPMRRKRALLRVFFTNP